MAKCFPDNAMANEIAVNTFPVVTIIIITINYSYTNNRNYKRSRHFLNALLSYRYRRDKWIPGSHWLTLPHTVEGRSNMRGQLQINFFVINMNTTYLFAWLHTMSISYQNRVMDTQKYNFHTKLHLCHIFFLFL